MLRVLKELAEHVPHRADVPLEVADDNVRLGRLRLLDVVEASRDRVPAAFAFALAVRTHL